MSLFVEDFLVVVVVVAVVVVVIVVVVLWLSEWLSALKKLQQIMKECIDTGRHAANVQSSVNRKTLGTLKKDLEQAQVSCCSCCSLSQHRRHRFGFLSLCHFVSLCDVLKGLCVFCLRRNEGVVFLPVSVCLPVCLFWTDFLLLSLFFRWIKVRFLPARRYASAGLCDSDVSGRPSVRPSHAGIVPSRAKAGSWNVHLLIAPSL